jgi:hypothetical protein
MFPYVKDTLRGRTKIQFVEYADRLSKARELSRSTNGSSTLWIEMKNEQRLTQKDRFEDRGKGTAKYGPKNQYIL